jgi:hypothetical protein
MFLYSGTCCCVSLVAFVLLALVRCTIRIMTINGVLMLNLGWSFDDSAQCSSSFTRARTTTLQIRLQHVLRGGLEYQLVRILIVCAACSSSRAAFTVGVSQWCSLSPEGTVDRL